MSTAHFRSPELLRMAAEHSCTIRLPGCTGGPCCSAHSNFAKHGKGKSVKAHDCFIAFACDSCHRKIDQGSDLSRDERYAAWERGHIATMLLIFAALLATKVQHRPRVVERRTSHVKPTADGLLPKIVPRRFT